MAFQGFLKQSTAVDILLGPFLDETNGKDAETGLTIEDEHVLLSKNGQGLTAKTDANDAGHDTGGYHNCPLGTTDTNTVGQLTITCHMSGALPVRLDYQIIEEAAYDAMYKAAAAGPNVVVPDAAGVVATALGDGTVVLHSDYVAAKTASQAGDLMLADMTKIHGTALTETDGLLAAGFKKFFNKASPTGTINSLADAVPGATGGGFIAGTNAATSVTTALTANITGTVSGNSTHTAANVLTALGTGTWITGAVWNSDWDAEVQSEVDDALTAYKAAKRTDMMRGA